MLGKMEIRSPPGSRPRDGRHCDLCGCSQPAVRCDKCGCQIFCLSCDDMYHRHPKRRFHLRKAVDPTPAVPQARPVLPMKISQLNATNPGDPSKMPLPPPRKKKTSLFGSFRKPNTPSDNSPPLPKKEYSWTDRLGSIKKFMSNRPLPPLPPTDDNDVESQQLQQPATNGQTTHDLSFIHRKSEERPPQLPQRSPRTPEFSGVSQEKENRIPNFPSTVPGQMKNGSMEPNTNHMNQNQSFPNSESNQWNNAMNNQNGFGTIRRQGSQRGFIPQGVPGYPGGMHQSSSATDLHSLHNADAMHGPVPPHYPHYPMNPHMPPHYPYPMYPQYPNYPQYFGNSFGNLSNPQTSEGDISDSESNTRHSSKRHAFRKRAKRSQSVMMDRMQAYPGQYFPFGAYPGYGPWGAPMPMEAPPSPASSIRSLNRAGRSRRRKKLTSEDDDEEFSVSSSPMSRTKSSSSDPKERTRAPLATQTTSSEEDSDEDAPKRRNKINTMRRQSEPERISSPSVDANNVSKPKKNSSKQSDSDAQDAPDIRNKLQPSMDSRIESPQPAPPKPPTPSAPPDTWECKHCTYINPITNRICQVCCKTATPRTETPQSRPSSTAAASKRNESASSEIICSSPEQFHEAEEDTGRKDKQDMASLNSALDEAEKQISKGLEELMKLKDDIDVSTAKEKSKTSDTQTQPDDQESSKPVYKSSGKMRTSILDKLNLNKPQTSNASVSTSTQASPNNWTSDKIIEARRYSNSSTNSTDAYNSPLAQSPELERGFKQKRDSSCQTQQDSLAEYLEKKRAAEEAFLGRPINNFGFGYGDRMDMVTSPVPSMYDRFFGGGYGGMMQRSHSRASLFTGRVNDFAPVDYGGPGFGYGPTPMYRSVSRSSLTGDYPDGRMSEFHNLRKPDYYLSMEELVERRRQDNIRAQGLELVRMIREAEQQGFNADDIQVALTHCGKQNPLEWLQENWRNMVDSVITLSTNYGNDKKENDIGLLSENEAREALRLHKGNIWAAVTECVEGRQRKYLELNARGNFSRQDIVDSLTSSDGDVEMAYAKLTKSTGKPFLMRIWGAGEGVQNQDGAQPVSEDFQDGPRRFYRDETLNSDEMSEELWSEDGDWDEEDYDGERTGDIEDLQTCREDLPTTSPQDMMTPESDRSEYCDAFPVVDKNASSPSDDMFFVLPERKPEKKKGFLSKLAALRKDSKELADVHREDFNSNQGFESKDDTISLKSTSSIEQSKNVGALNTLKSTFSAIKDTVTGATKTEKKVPCSQLDRRTIIVKGQIDHASVSTDQNDGVNLTSIKRLDEDISLNIKSENEQNEKPGQDAGFQNKSKFPAADGKSDKSDLKENIQNQKSKNDTIDSNSSDSANKVETNKSQSLAERLKFAKQNRGTPSTSSASVSQQHTNVPDSKIKEAIIIKESTITENNKERFTINEENKNTPKNVGKTADSDKNDYKEPPLVSKVPETQNVTSDNSVKSTKPILPSSDTTNNITTKTTLPPTVEKTPQQQIQPLDQTDKESSPKVKTIESKSVAAIRTQSVSPVGKTFQRENHSVNDDKTTGKIETAVSNSKITGKTHKSGNSKATVLSENIATSEISKTDIKADKRDNFEVAETNINFGSVASDVKNSGDSLEKQDVPITGSISSTSKVDKDDAQKPLSVSDNNQSTSEINTMRETNDVSSKQEEKREDFKTKPKQSDLPTETVTNENFVADNKVIPSHQKKKIEESKKKKLDKQSVPLTLNSTEKIVDVQSTSDMRTILTRESGIEVSEINNEHQAKINNEQHAEMNNQHAGKSNEQRSEIINQQHAEIPKGVDGVISENSEIKSDRVDMNNSEHISTDESLNNARQSELPSENVSMVQSHERNLKPEEAAIPNSSEKVLEKPSVEVIVEQKSSVESDNRESVNQEISQKMQESGETAKEKEAIVLSTKLENSSDISSPIVKNNVVSESVSITSERNHVDSTCAIENSKNGDISDKTNNSEIQHQSSLEKEPDNNLQPKVIASEVGNKNSSSIDSSKNNDLLLEKVATDQPSQSENITQEPLNTIESQSQLKQSESLPQAAVKSDTSLDSLQKADINASTKENTSENSFEPAQASINELQNKHPAETVAIPSTSKADEIEIQAPLSEAENKQESKTLSDISQVSSDRDIKTEPNKAELSISNLTNQQNNLTSPDINLSKDTNQLDTPQKDIPKDLALSSPNIVTESPQTSLPDSSKTTIPSSSVHVADISKTAVTSSSTHATDSSIMVATSSNVEPTTSKSVEVSPSKTIANDSKKKTSASFKSSSETSKSIESSTNKSTSDNLQSSEVTSSETLKVDSDIKPTTNDNSNEKELSTTSIANNSVTGESVADVSKSVEPSTSSQSPNSFTESEAPSSKISDSKLISAESATNIKPSTAKASAEQHSIVSQTSNTDIPSSSSKEQSNTASISQNVDQNKNDENLKADDSEGSEIEDSDESRPSSVTPPSPVDALRNRFEILAGGTIRSNTNRPASPFRRMSFNSRKQVIALEKKRDTTADKPWFREKIVKEPAKIPQPRRTIKQQLELERKVRKMVADRKCRTYRKAEIVVQLMDMNFEEEEAIQAANECSTLEMAVSYLQQECYLCAGNFPVSQIVSMTHCEHRACRECIRAYFTVQIRDRTILDLLCPFCNEPDIGDEDIAQDYFNHLDIMLKKLVDVEIHELFQRKLRDRVLMKDPNFRWCSQCSSGFIAMPNLKRLICPDCNAITCASCRRLWEKEHQGISCEAFAALKDASDPDTQATNLAKILTEDGIDCPSCHFRYALAKGGCMHFRCIQCQHDFCSGCSRPFKMGQKCGVSEFCAKLGLHAHHPRNCLFYLRDKEPADLQKLLDMNDIKYDRDPPSDGTEFKSCPVMEQKETADGMVDDYCGKDVEDGYAGLCRVHYVEYLGQLVNKHRVDPIQIFDNDDLELVLRRANIRLPPKRYRESDVQFREKLVDLIEEKLPLDKMDGS